MDHHHVDVKPREGIPLQENLNIEEKKEQPNVQTTAWETEGTTMLLEATMAMLVLMGVTWAGAIWTSFQDPRKTHDHSLTRKFPAKIAA